MRIDRDRFGSIEIDGETYRGDVLVLPERLVCPWSRERGGHVYDRADLGLRLTSGADGVVLRTGRFGRVMVPQARLAAFADIGVDVVAGLHLMR